jgi:hypothetical protein
MLFFSFSVCLSIALSIPSEYFELKVPQEVQNCTDEHWQVVRVCSLTYIAIILNGTLKYDQLIKSNPEAVPDSVKKNLVKELAAQALHIGIRKKIMITRR